MKRLFIIFFLIFGVSALFGGDKSFLYEVQKGGKKLGLYEIVLLQNGDITTSYTNASNKIPFFLQKELHYIQDGYKSIVFYKNKKAHLFHVYTDKTALTKKEQKVFARKLKKVQTNKMLLVLRDGKKGNIELFNKREIVIKTFDELLVDAMQNKLNYNKAILFDKNGVMKMVIEVKKEANGYVIQNSRKNKPYMAVDVKNGLVTSVRSLVSNWSIKLLKTGEYISNTLPLSQVFAKTFEHVNSFGSTEIVLKKPIKVTKGFYGIDGEVRMKLPADMAGKKSYEQTAYCKKLFKKAKLKYKKVTLKEGICTAKVKTKLKRKTFDKSIRFMMAKEFGTKKYTITDESLIYKTVAEGN